MKTNKNCNVTNDMINIIPMRLEPEDKIRLQDQAMSTSKKLISEDACKDIKDFGQNQVKGFKPKI